MKHFKRPVLSLMLMCVLAGAAFADPSCANPGQTNAPPCSSQSVSDDSIDPGQTSSPPALPGQTETPPASNTVDLVDIVNATLWALSLF